MAGDQGSNAQASAPQTDESTERIIDAALEELAVHGPTKARMADIAERAGVSSATLYRRFAAKQELMQAVSMREIERFVSAMREVAAEQQTAEATVTECFAFAIDYVRENTIVHQLIEAEPELYLPQLTTGAGPLLEAVTTYMLKLNEDNIFVERDDWDRELAKVRHEMMVRLFISLLLTQGTAIDVSTPEASREFARKHVVPLLVQAESPGTARRGGGTSPA